MVLIWRRAAMRVRVGLSVAQVGPYLGGSAVDILDRACGVGP
jgi:hypothetical protein